MLIYRKKTNLKDFKYHKYIYTTNYRSEVKKKNYVYVLVPSKKYDYVLKLDMATPKIVHAFQSMNTKCQRNEYEIWIVIIEAYATSVLQTEVS